MFNYLRPFQRSDVASAAYTSTTNGSTLTLPLAESYQFILDVTAISGSGCTLDVLMQTSPDNGTTFYSTGPAFRQFTTDGGTGVDILRVNPSQGSREAGQEWQAWSSTTGGPIAQNLILTRRYRWRFVLGGTGGSPTASATCQVWLMCQPKGSAGRV